MKIKLKNSFIILILLLFFDCSKNIDQNNLYINSNLAITQIDSLIFDKLELLGINYRDSLFKVNKNSLTKYVYLPINYRFEQMFIDLNDLFIKHKISIANSFTDKYETVFNLSLNYGRKNLKYKFFYDKNSYYDVSIALVIINFGLYDINIEKKILNLPINYTVSILPYYKNSDIILKNAKKNAKEIIINMPMEPKIFPILGGNKKLIRVSNYINQYGILARFDNSTILNRLKSVEEYFSWTNVVGMTNFRGYKIVRDKNILSQLFNYCKQKNYYFLYTDDLDNSIIDTVGLNSGAKIIKYDYIIDDIDNKRYIQNMFEKAIKLAHKKGEVVIILHPRKNSYDVLKDVISKNRENGVKFVYLNSLIEKGDIIW